MSVWSCGSCASWGDSLADLGVCRVCRKTGRVVSADCNACENFSRALRTYTVQEAVAKGILNVPRKIDKL